MVPLGLQVTATLVERPLHSTRVAEFGLPERSRKYLQLGTQEALVVLAAREVAASRELEESTWEQVGEVFAIRTQAAHHRFARK